MRQGKRTYAKVTVSVRVKAKGKKPLVFRRDTVVETSAVELERLMKQAEKKGLLGDEGS